MTHPTLLRKKLEIGHVRLKLYFSYEGTDYHGLQRQKGVSKTIQEVFENKISQITNTRLHIVSSGRTDAGVHARIQVAHVDVPVTVTTRFALDRLLQALNSILPKDIRVLKIEPAHPEFHANFGVKKKTYLYFIDPSPIQAPSLRAYSWHLRNPLDFRAMHEAAKAFKGRHDFAAFCSADSSAKTTVRRVFEARFEKVRVSQFGFEPEFWVYRVTGEGFLKNMVRAMVGTLVMIGGGKAPVSRVSEGLRRGNRSLCGPTAPPHGLWLWDILY